MTVRELYDALGSLITQKNDNMPVLMCDTDGNTDLYLVTDLELRQIKNCTNELTDVLVIM